MAEKIDEYRERAKRERVRIIIGDGWFVTMVRNARNWQGRDPEQAWQIVRQSSRSERTGDSLAARANREDRSKAWSYKASLAFEKKLDNGQYAYDFPKWPRIYGAKLYPVLEWVIATPEVHHDKTITLREISDVLRMGGPPAC